MSVINDLCYCVLLQVSKGAPQVILNMAYNRDELRPRVEAAVQEVCAFPPIHQQYPLLSPPASPFPRDSVYVN